jgi:pyruvate,water dikinase
LAVFDGLLAGCETKTALVNREIHELAGLAAQSATLRAALLRGGREFWESGGLDRHPAFAARFLRFLEDHGHREMDMDYAQPTWAGQPWVVLESIALILRSGSTEDPASVARQLRIRYAATELSFLSAVPEEVRFFFREMIRLARTYTTLDDLEHYQTTRVNPVARQAAIVLGQRLVEEGILDTPEDVFYFRRSELEQLIHQLPHVDRDACRA